MENESRKKKETDDSTPHGRRKGGLKFAPKVLPKKAPKIIPKTAPHEESKTLMIDKKMMTMLGRVRSTDAPGSGAKAEKQGTLDEEEFKDSSNRAQYGELTAAEELGLMERVDTLQLLFFQFPTSLPLPRQADPAMETDTDPNVDANVRSNGNNRKWRHHLVHGCNLKELPGGLIGKMLVQEW